MKKHGHWLLLYAALYLFAGAACDAAVYVIQRHLPWTVETADNLFAVTVFGPFVFALVGGEIVRQYRWIEATIGRFFLLILLGFVQACAQVVFYLAFMDS